MEHQLFIVKIMCFVNSSLILLTLRRVFEGTINYDCIFEVFLSTVPFMFSLLRRNFEGRCHYVCIFTRKNDAPQMRGSRQCFQAVIQDSENPYR